MNIARIKSVPAALLGAAILLGGCATSPTARSPVLIQGQGSPALVLQSGFGDGKAIWQDVIAQLPPGHRVFAYDRPGSGDNPPVDGPRDPCSIADELHRMLHSAGVQPPYLLVGHSLGGLYQYVYARRYPEEVAGLLLLDPTHPRNWETVQRTAPHMALLLRAIKATAMNRSMADAYR